MVNDQWLILQHWRGGLQVLLVTKNCFIILGRRFVMWWERRIDSLVGRRIAIRPYMCDTTLVLGICWLHFSLFTFHFSPHTQAYSLGYTLHSSLFTLHSSPHTQAHSLGYTLHSSFFILHSLYHCSSSERGILRGGWRHSTEPVRASGASSWGLVPSLR